MDELDLLTLLYLFGETLEGQDKAEWLRLTEMFNQWREAEKDELRPEKESENA